MRRQQVAPGRTAAFPTEKSGVAETEELVGK